MPQTIYMLMKVHFQNRIEDDGHERGLVDRRCGRSTQKGPPFSFIVMSGDVTQTQTRNADTKTGIGKQTNGEDTMELCLGYLQNHGKDLFSGP